MNRTTAILAASVLATTLSACGSNNLFSRDRPDEFAVSRQAPLVVPPDFSLTPPAPGAARPGGETTAEQTLRALFGGAAPRSATETSIIGSADGQRGDPGIRSNVGSPNTQVVDKGLVTRDIIFAPEGDGRDASAAIPTS
ncbi:DUF3035 domain-containing protein [Sphingopyxis sp. BSN-002]|uniref:DUF3035 domain-containing protein n=1 Tax=Sphingopyxis sp. BSN-002 TaxID=2911495 RepID=UPI001EDB8A57|nr:DUF3035 domain-containing protein [Sphingopyxis sp. BSN-002]UKK83324.1 DUF3035 domain-containing protein [Sphingopyxis sp. BSN-002]